LQRNYYTLKNSKIVQLFTSNLWTDYELIDTGGLEKLERFGKYILIRPEPQAIWEKALSEKEWADLSHATYKRTKGVDPSRNEYSEKGAWSLKQGMPEQWYIGYSYKEMQLKFRLGLTAFGHVGVFPEQANNWNFIYDFLNPHDQIPSPDTLHPPTPSSGGRGGVRFRVLNLFAYTGGASLAAKAAGADVTHVDSVKPVIQWARDIMDASGFKDIRWVVEDALKFVRREVKRGNHYDGIILDPPAYGRGPEGEKWILSESLDEMVHLCQYLLEADHGLFILSLYSMGFSPLICDNLVRTHFTETGQKEFGELVFTDRSGRNLPLGTVLRFQK
jgi:23S rRNA (cytosine1962-C5)-methyltransferase